MVFRYRTFGLRIASDLALGPDTDPKLVEGEEADLRVAVRSIADDAPGRRLRWDDVCQLGVSGKELWVVPSARASEREVALAVSHAGLALALEERGELVLHGSCVAIQGRAVCLLGDSGAGKSTLATALVRAGHQLVSDGMTVVRWSDQAPRVAPGWRQVKLLPDAARVLGWEPERLPAVVNGSNKVLCDVSTPIEQRDFKLTTALLLLTGAPPSASSILPGRAAFELLRNAFLVERTTPREQAALLDRCARVANAIRVKTLVRGDRLDRVAEVAALVERLVGEASAAT